MVDEQPQQDQQAPVEQPQEDSGLDTKKLQAQLFKSIIDERNQQQQPQAQHQSGVGDVLKSLIAPAIIGGLTYLGAPRGQRFATGIGNAINYWGHQQDMQARWGNRGQGVKTAHQKALEDTALLGALNAAQRTEQTGEHNKNIEKIRGREATTGETREARLAKSDEEKGVRAERKLTLDEQVANFNEDLKKRRFALDQSKEKRLVASSADEAYSRKLNRDLTQARLDALKDTDKGKIALAKWLRENDKEQEAMEVEAGAKPKLGGGAGEKTTKVKVWDPEIGNNVTKKLNDKEINERGIEEGNADRIKAADNFRTTRMMMYELNRTIDDYIKTLPKDQQDKALKSVVGTGNQLLEKLKFKGGLPIDPKIAKILTETQTTYAQLAGSASKAMGLRASRMIDRISDHLPQAGMSLGAIKDRLTTMDDMLDVMALGINYTGGVKNKDHMDLYKQALGNDETFDKMFADQPIATAPTSPAVGGTYEAELPK